MRRNLAPACGLALAAAIVLATETPRAEPADAAIAPVVELLDPGSEPRRPLRMQLGAGSEETVDFELRVGFLAGLGQGATPTVQAPRVDSVMRVRVDSVDAKGEATLSLSIDEVEIEPVEGMLAYLLESVRSSLERLRGVECSYRLTQRGFVHAMRCSEGPERDLIRVHEQARESIRNAYVLLPEEPVGIGARWRARTEEREDEASWQGEREFALVSEKDGHHQIAVRARRTRTRELSSPGPSAKLEVETWARGQVDLVVDAPLSRALLDGGARYDTKLQTGAAVGSQHPMVRMELDVRARLRPR